VRSSVSHRAPNENRVKQGTDKQLAVTLAIFRRFCKFTHRSTDNW
jgi:hypothetical protein